MKELAGRRAALATRHGKERALGPALAGLGIEIAVAAVDTDAFGTFTGEVPRPGDMLETAVAKARAGMARLGLDLGLASEGAFGGSFGGLAAGATELVALVDDAAGRVVHVVRSGLRTNHGMIEITSAAALGDFPDRVGFPEHGLVVQVDAPADGGPALEEKGIVDAGRLEAAVGRALERSAGHRARVETDMRAHLNPTRMATIAEVAGALAERLAARCPACGARGAGPVDVRRGLPCADCGAPTSLVRAVVEGCEACGRREERPRDDGLSRADPQWCPLCNP